MTTTLGPAFRPAMTLPLLLFVVALTPAVSTAQVTAVSSEDAKARAEPAAQVGTPNQFRRPRCGVGLSGGHVRSSGGFIGFVPEAPRIALESRIDPEGSGFSFTLTCDFLKLFAGEFVMPVMLLHHEAVLRDLALEPRFRERGNEIGLADTYPQIPLMGRLVMSLLPGRFRPYVSGGWGVLPNIDADRFNPTWSIGMGVSVDLSRRLSVRAEANQYRTRFSDHLDGSVEAIGVDVSYTDSIKFSDFNAGLVVRLGR